MATRKTWRQSWAYLKRLGVALPDDEGGKPDVCDRPEAGQADFRGLTLRDHVFEEVDFESLCLLRTLVVGCRFQGVSFRDADLTLCCLNGCQFVDCDFSDARLIRADLGACGFFACRFVRTALIGADLRGSTFAHCDFTDAVLTGACFDRTWKETLPLSEEQRDLMVDWRRKGDEGPNDG
jgi:hypothetical protein